MEGKISRLALMEGKISRSGKQGFFAVVFPNREFGMTAGQLFLTAKIGAPKKNTIFADRFNL